MHYIQNRKDLGSNHTRSLAGSWNLTSLAVSNAVINIGLVSCGVLNSL